MLCSPAIYIELQLAIDTQHLKDAMKLDSKAINADTTLKDMFVMDWIHSLLDLVAPELPKVPQPAHTRKKQLQVSSTHDIKRIDETYTVIQKFIFNNDDDYHMSSNSDGKSALPISDVDEMLVNLEDMGTSSTEERLMEEEENADDESNEEKDDDSDKDEVCLLGWLVED